ncbi:MAG: energy transducer TonB [Alistipes sp.]|nr:energy transducer TonB [Alistipes sp.]
MRIIFALIVSFLVFGMNTAGAQKRSRTPVYIVNGERMTEQQVKEIDPADIVDNQLLAIDEQIIAKYGNEASNGVVLITLRYDTPAMFVVDGIEQSYSNYIADRVKWTDTDGVARVIISLTVGEDGSIVATDVLEATDKRLLRRVQSAIEEAPRWQPALKSGKGVATEHLLRITLPKGRKMPREQVVRIRG